MADVVASIRINWNEPEGCSSARGWAYLPKGSHPDGAAEYSCCGNYIDYGPFGARGPGGETFHAVAYILRSTFAGYRTHPLGYAWFWTVQDAREWIERAVTLELERLQDDGSGISLGQGNVVLVPRDANGKPID